MDLCEPLLKLTEAIDERPAGICEIRYRSVRACKMARLLLGRNNWLLQVLRYTGTRRRWWWSIEDLLPFVNDPLQLLDTFFQCALVLMRLLSFWVHDDVGSSFLCITNSKSWHDDTIGWHHVGSFLLLHSCRIRSQVDNILLGHRCRSYSDGVTRRHHALWDVEPWELGLRLSLYLETSEIVYHYNLINYMELA